MMRRRRRRQQIRFVLSTSEEREGVVRKPSSVQPKPTQARPPPPPPPPPPPSLPPSLPPHISYRYTHICIILSRLLNIEFLFNPLFFLVLFFHTFLCFPPFSSVLKIEMNKEASKERTKERKEKKRKKTLAKTCTQHISEPDSILVCQHREGRGQPVISSHCAALYSLGWIRYERTSREEKQQQHWRPN